MPLLVAVIIANFTQQAHGTVLTTPYDAYGGCSAGDFYSGPSESISTASSGLPIGCFVLGDFEENAALTITGGLDPAIAISASSASTEAATNCYFASFAFSPGCGIAGKYTDSAGAYGQLIYGIQVVGPPTPLGVGVPVLMGTTFSDSLSETLSDGGTSSALVYVRICCNPDGSLVGFWDGQYTGEQLQEALLLEPNAIFSIILWAQCSVNQVLQSLACAAGVDPTFAIDPSYPDASEYSIAYSVGLVTTTAPSSIPEPGTLALMGSGLMALFLSRRHYSRHRVRLQVMWPISIPARLN